MPIAGGKQQPDTLVPFFRSLKDLDQWTPASDRRTLDGIIPFFPRREPESTTQGKLLVCHDYKGGYTESPFAQSYTFNFWSSCEIFVYFAHHRVTIPPPGWINAAHRQGVKMLGTLIFEGGGEEDCLRLLVGKMPQSKTGPVEQTAQPLSLPLSPHYAIVLADLAKERGFDGYLLNFECPLQGKIEQTRALAAWITLLQAEIMNKVGPHGETLWYDSVIFTGHLRWQDRLNSLNLPFFLSSTGLFSNYTWPPNYPAATAQYFLSLDPALTGTAPDSQPHVSPKSLRDIFMGVDVWGRGSHGGGGFGSYKAITHIAPESLGLSVALFGQAWTWESEQDKPGWSWDKWWEYESKLWVGPVNGGAVDVPEAPRREGEPECLHGPFVPIASFFPRHSPPDPFDIPFHTTFSPGVGRAWFVEGSNVFQSANGWTDVDKQTSVGDMVWPRPVLKWEDEREDPIFTATSALCVHDAWNGGSCLWLTLSDPGSAAELAAYRCVWLPVQSLLLTPQRKYAATIVMKVDFGDDDVDVECALSVRSSHAVEVIPISDVEVANGWTKLSIEFTVSGDSLAPVSAAIGLVVAVVSADATKPVNVSLFLGQLDVYPSLPLYIQPDHHGLILWADFQRSAREVPFSGILSWEIAASFPHVTSISITTPDDPVSAWKLQPTATWFPSFVYFNIYALPYTSEFVVGKVEDAKWIGTSGLDGRKLSFTVVQDNLPYPKELLLERKKVRFYVQGVTDRGEILAWAKCAYVDVSV